MTISRCEVGSERRASCGELEVQAEKRWTQNKEYMYFNFYVYPIFRIESTCRKDQSKIEAFIELG
jgi:hypothetical protein